MDQLINELRSNLPQPFEISSGFSVEKFLFELEIDNDSNDMQNILNRLCKKLDVVGIVRAVYNENLSKKVTDQKLHKQYMIYFGAILLYFSDKSANYKYLNTALKIIDRLEASDSKILQTHSLNLLAKI